jgi:hypothetical protein
MVAAVTSDAACKQLLLTIPLLYCAWHLPGYAQSLLLHLSVETVQIYVQDHSVGELQTSLRNRECGESHYFISDACTLEHNSNPSDEAARGQCVFATSKAAKRGPCRVDILAKFKQLTEQTVDHHHIASSHTTLRLPLVTNRPCICCV